MLFLGSGWEVMISTAAMQNQFGIMAGLGALISLDRLGRRGDVLTAALLVVSLASFTIGLAFALAVATWILLERVPGSSLRRLWVAAVPVVIYAVWFAWARKYHQGETSSEAVAAIGSGIVDQLSAILGGLTGLGRNPPGAKGAFGRTDALAYVFIALIAWRLIRGPRLTPAQGAALVALAAYLVLIALGLSDIRQSNASRYVYMGGLLVLLVAVELWPVGGLSRRWIPVAVVVAGVSIASNLASLHGGGEFIEQESAANRAELGALVLARDQVDPGFVPESGDFGTGDKPEPIRDLIYPSSEIFAATDDLGSPADTEDEIATETPAARSEADRMSVAALGIAVTESSGSSGDEAPAEVSSSNADIDEGGGCLEVKPEETGPAVVVVNPVDGRVSYSADAPPTLISVGRFADGEPIELQGGGEDGEIAIPADAAAREWRVSLVFAGSAKVCG
jgi:hypothetical protein